MPLARTYEHGRFATLALAGIFIASACSTAASEPSAAVPGTPQAVPSHAPSMSPAAASDAPVFTTAPPVASPLASIATPVPSIELAAVEETKPARVKPKIRKIRLKPRPKRGPFRMNLYERGDFMHQQTKDWCVAGSTQIMMNIIRDGKPNRSAGFQKRLYVKGRRLSPNKAKLGPIGVDLIGWAELLNTSGHGPYVVDGAATRRGAIKKAAKAIRMTGKPVGLVVWRGAHSWVMSGFTATADPAFTNDFVVKKVHIQDTWYPYVSSIWGASRPPDTLVPVAALAEDYLQYRRPRARWPKRDGRYMLILPTLPKNTVAR